MTRLLVSAPVCDLDAGSEATVGAHTLRMLSRCCSTALVTLGNQTIRHAGVTVPLSGAFDDPNDVSSFSLLAFERRQRRWLTRTRLSEYDVVHRITPSGWKPTLLQPLPSHKVVVGPVLMSTPPPIAFREIFQPPWVSGWRRRLTLRRLFNSFSRRYLERYGTPLLDRADLILAGTLTTLSRLTPRQRERAACVTYAGVEHETFVPAARRRRRKEFQLLFVGRLIPYKGPELLLRAVAQARSAINCRLRIVGTSTPAMLDYFRQRAVQLGVADITEFIAPVPRSALVKYYQAADVFCMPSIETYGLAILEAMSTGCVPLVADLNGPGEIVAEGWGRKVPLVTPEQFAADFAAQIVELSEQPELCERIGIAARLRVIACHDWPRVTQQIFRAYENAGIQLDAP